MMEIKLTQGKFSFVDDEDYSRINQHKWRAVRSKYNSNSYVEYAITNIYKSNKQRSTISMHRFILNAKKGEVVDHINGNGLDNRKFNLRLCTQRQNVRNQKKQLNTSSKYKGLYWNKNRHKWQAEIMINKKLHYLGLFISEIDAAKAYDTAAKKYFGKYAKLNFNELGEKEKGRES